MTTALQAPHPHATDARRRSLASAAWNSIHLNNSGVSDQTMEAAHSGAVRLSRAANVRRRGALRSGKNGRRP
jgi:hypothetical protein